MQNALEPGDIGTFSYVNDVSMSDNNERMVVVADGLLDELTSFALSFGWAVSEVKSWGDDQVYVEFRRINKF